MIANYCNRCGTMLRTPVQSRGQYYAQYTPSYPTPNPAESNSNTRPQLIKDVIKIGLGRALDSIRNKLAVLSDGSKRPGADRIGTAQWAEVATSQTNQWMTAFRFHESGNYHDAWPHYLTDAEKCRRVGDFGKASLSFLLAADCLTSIGKPPLAAKMVSLASECYNQQTLTSKCLEEAIADKVRSLSQTSTACF